MYKLLFLLLFAAVVPYCAAQETIYPQFPGDEQQLEKYMKQQTAPFLQKNKQAVAIVFFYVDTEGKIVRPMVATSYSNTPDFPTDSLALAIINRMPAWIPGTVDGIPQEIPVGFTIRFGEEENGSYRHRIPDSEAPSLNSEPVEYASAEAPAEEVGVTVEVTAPYTRPDETAYVTVSDPERSQSKETEQEETDVELVASPFIGEDFVVVSSVDEEPFVIVEQMPEFPGGEAELQNYIATHLKYPVIAQENEIEGKVAVRFVVEKDGTLSGVEVMRGIYPVCDQEAIRLMQNCPKWIPGKQNGTTVRVYVTYMIPFKLQH